MELIRSWWTSYPLNYYSNNIPQVLTSPPSGLSESNTNAVVNTVSLVITYEFRRAWKVNRICSATSPNLLTSSTMDQTLWIGYVGISNLIDLADKGLKSDLGIAMWLPQFMRVTVQPSARKSMVYGLQISQREDRPWPPEHSGNL